MFPIDVKKFVEKYRDNCVNHYSPARPEEGFQRIIYQITTTLHIELCAWVWCEHNIVHSYAFATAVYHDELECSKFVGEIYEFRKTGDTENKPTPSGFAGAIFRPENVKTNFDT